jgi:hypothetical protein
MSETPLHGTPAPQRGEANADVLVGELGYETDDLRILSDRGVS